MTSIDELLRAFASPTTDEREVADLAAAREALDRQFRGRGTPPAATARQRSLRSAVRLLPVALACAVALAIAAVALSVSGEHRHGRTSLQGPAAGRAADQLIARLGVLRRPQVPSDRLPSGMIVEGHPRVGTIDRSRYGAIIPGLTRLVATRPQMRIYLVVTTPPTSARTLWPATDGDQVGTVAITPRGAVESPGYPAVDLADASQVAPVLPPQPAGRQPIHQRDQARQQAPQGYQLSIVPDGVARVTWTFREGAHRTRAFTATVTDNVAISQRGPTPLVTAASWRRSDGTTFPTSDRPQAQAIAAQRARLRQSALSHAERQHPTVPTTLLNAFPVFSYDSRKGTRTPDGYTISHPSLEQLPLEVLQAVGDGPLAPRQIRQVTGPTGLTMWVIPGPHGLCVVEIDPPTPQPLGPSVNRGSGASCSTDIHHALVEGDGMTVGTAHGLIHYVVFPRTVRTITIVPSSGPSRTVHPSASVYIGRANYHAG